MIISEIQSEIGHCSCDGAKFKEPADFSHHAILLYEYDIVLDHLILRENSHMHSCVHKPISYPSICHMNFGPQAW